MFQHVGWVSFCFDSSDNILKRGFSCTEVQHCPRCPSDTGCGCTSLCLQQEILGYQAHREQCSPLPTLVVHALHSVSFSIAPFLSTSPDSYRPSVAHVPLSSPTSPRTRQFCRASLGCLSPGKFNCSTSAESGKQEILSWSQSEGLYIAVRALPLRHEAPPAAEVCELSPAQSWP